MGSLPYSTEQLLHACESAKVRTDIIMDAYIDFDIGTLSSERDTSTRGL